MYILTACSVVTNKECSQRLHYLQIQHYQLLIYFSALSANTTLPAVNILFFCRLSVAN